MLYVSNISFSTSYFVRRLNEWQKYCTNAWSSEIWRSMLILWQRGQSARPGKSAAIALWRCSRGSRHSMSKTEKPQTAASFGDGAIFWWPPAVYRMQSGLGHSRSHKGGVPDVLEYCERIHLPVLIENGLHHVELQWQLVVCAFLIQWYDFWCMKSWIFNRTIEPN